MIEYSDEDKTRSLAEIDRSFAKALSSAGTGYLDQGIRLDSPYARTAARDIREEVSPLKEGVETRSERETAAAERGAERGTEDLSAGYIALKKRQELSGKAKTEDIGYKKTEVELERGRLKAGLAAARKEEERKRHVEGQIKKFI